MFLLSGLFVYPSLSSCFLCILIYLVTFLKVGVGMSMEGIEQNPVVYDLMSEMAFQHNKVDVKVLLSFFLNALRFWKFKMQVTVAFKWCSILFPLPSLF